MKALSVEPEVVIDSPWLERSTKDRRKVQREVGRLLRAEGRAEALRAMYRYGMPVPPGMLEEMDRLGVVKKF